MKKISVVIPVYNEEESIVHSVDVVMGVLENIQYDYEIVLVNDGSTDRTWDAVTEAHEKYKNRVKAVSFTRNFGKEAALIAGLEYASGDAVITIDADLQHPPEKIPEFLEKWEDGYKIVEGRKEDRGKENVIKRGFSHLFYRMMTKAIGEDVSDYSDYKLVDWEVVDTILRLPERQMFYRAITSWSGFEAGTVSYVVEERQFGKSKWKGSQLIRYAIKNITSYTSSPLQITTFLSIVFFLFGLIIGGKALYDWIVGNAVSGFTTVILLLLITGSCILFALGLIGYYLSKLYEEVRHRPRYVVGKTIEEEETKPEDKNNG